MFSSVLGSPASILKHSRLGACSASLPPQHLCKMQSTLSLTFFFATHLCSNQYTLAPENFYVILLFIPKILQHSPSCLGVVVLLTMPCLELSALASGALQQSIKSPYSLCLPLLTHLTCQLVSHRSVISL